MSAATLGLAALTISVGPGEGSQAAGAAPATSEVQPGWLAEVNRYREASGLQDVTDQPAWDQGLVRHFTYLEQTLPSYRTGQYASQHTENPASPFFTPDGATEAGRSDLDTYLDATPVQHIDDWLTAPFHALGMLRPNLNSVAFAEDAVHGGLDVIGGITGQETITSPILFPGPGMTTNLTSFSGGEFPSPLESCGDAWNAATAQGQGVGLPLIALLPAAPPAVLSATLSGPAMSESSAAGTLCIVDSATYRSSDAVYGPTGQALLAGPDNPVFLIPQVSLQAGQYTATIDLPSQPPVSWSFTASPPLAQPVVGIASTADGGGYWLVNDRGAVSLHGDARSFGSMAAAPLDAPITHIAATPDGKGYWLVAGDGGVFSFGDARFFGSVGGQALNAPVVDLAPTADGGGYWLVAGDGGVFSFGDAPFDGSMGGAALQRPVVGVAPDAVTGGYWLVGSDGGIFAFDAPFFGSAGDMGLASPVVGMAPASGDTGYRFVAADGGVFAYGAPFAGSERGQPIPAPIEGMATDPATGGYWLVGQDGSVYGFDAPDDGSD